MITPLVGPFVAASMDAVTLNDRFLMSMTLPSLSRFIPGNSTWLVPVISCGRPAMVAFSRSNRRSSIGSTLYFDRLDQPQPLQLRQPLRLLGGEVPGLGKVVVAVVELPDVVVQRGSTSLGSHGVLCRVTALQPLK